MTAQPVPLDPRIVQALSHVTTATLTTVLLKKGLRNVWIRGAAPLRADSPRIADLVSGWLLAERAPLALPDGRWDRLLYALNDCEQFLRARAPGV